MAKKFAFYNTDEGQHELVAMDADRTSRTREALGLSTLTEHASMGQILPMGGRNESEWVEIEMTADSGDDPLSWRATVGNMDRGGPDAETHGHPGGRCPQTVVEPQRVC